MINVQEATSFLMDTFNESVIYFDKFKEDLIRRKAIC